MTAPASKEWQWQWKKNWPYFWNLKKIWKNVHFSAVYCRFWDTRSVLFDITLGKQYRCLLTVGFASQNLQKHSLDYRLKMGLTALRARQKENWLVGSHKTDQWQKGNWPPPTRKDSSSPPRGVSQFPFCNWSDLREVQYARRSSATPCNPIF